MKKVGLLILIVFITIILASVYGVLHNQISFSISKEYFTKFKFRQFGNWLLQLPSYRFAVAYIGIMSTWWFGLFVGFIIAVFGCIQTSPKIMWESSMGAIFRSIGITIIFSFLGILIGYFFVSNLEIDWNILKGLTNKKDFLIAGTMHNFSYLGGIIGLVYGIRHQFKVKNNNS